MDYRPDLGGETGCSRNGEVTGKVKVSCPHLVLCLLPVVLLACSRQDAPQKPSAESILQQIPAADPVKYDHVQNTKDWRNPYLIVRVDGVVLYDTADSAEILLKPEDVIGALAQLPRSNWPYGRVVAAAEVAAASDEAGVAIRRNKGLVGGLLEEAHVAIKWVPAT